MKKPGKIIFVSLDTLRADHLGCYGYKRDTSPFIDSFQKECVFFKWAFSASSYTVPSHASMFTGKYPDRHTFGFANSDLVLYKPDSEIMIQEIFNAQDYETAGFVSALPLRKEIGFHTGYRYYDDKCTTKEINRPDELFRNGEETNQKVFEWLDENGNKDFFMFIHYFDIHGPYTNPEGFREVFVDDNYCGEKHLLEIKEQANPVGGIPDYEVLRPVRDKSGKLLSYEQDAGYYIAEYDGGIKYEDSIMEQLVRKLKYLNIYDDCLIILTSDHGEAFGENDVWFFHGLTVTPDQIHVPLLIKPHRGWGVESKTIESHVSLVDIFPTLCSITDFDYSALDINGTSLINLIENGKDDALEARIIHSEIEGQIAHIDGRKICVKPKHVEKDKAVFYYIEELCNKEAIFSYRNSATALEFTGERYVPWADDPAMNYEHLHRYRFVKEFIKGKKVLDLGCGEGYGSFMLSDYAYSVTGIDIADEAVRHASFKYQKENIKFIQGSMADVPIEGEGLFDVVVCFEALEHMTEQDELMREVKRLLKKDGILFVSTPNKHELHSENPGYQNEFHVKELDLDEFKSLLTGNFKNISLYGQKVYPSSNIFPLYEEGTTSREFLIEKVDGEYCFLNSVKKKATLFIAIASDGNLDSNKFAEKSNLLDVSGSYFHSMDAHISNLENALSNRDNHISNLEGTLQSKDLYISSLEATIANNEERLKLMPDIVKNLIEGLRQESISPSLSVRIGEVCFSLGIFDSADYLFKKALAVDPGNSEALNNLGVLCCQEGDYETARSYFIKSLDHNPEYEEAKVNLDLVSSVDSKSEI
jgi:arylsulfatase